MIQPNIPRLPGAARLARLAHAAVWRGRLLTAVCALACLVVAGYWAMRLHAARQAGAPPARPVAAPLVSGEGARLFGARPAEDSDLPVIVSGVIRAGSDGGMAGGAAVLAVDGKPPRLVVVGREAAPGLVLVAVGERLAVLSRNGVRREVRMVAPARVPVLAFTAGGRERDGGVPAVASNVARAGSSAAVK